MPARDGHLHGEEGDRDDKIERPKRQSRFVTSSEWARRRKSIFSIYRFVQSSIVRFGTRANSRTLLVTRIRL
jgi:hypothetical protein